MPKIRHIAIRSDDCEAQAKFFVEVFGLELVQRREHGPIDLTDGEVNITLLPTNLGGRQTPPGFEHIGFSTENATDVHDKLLAHGATEMNPVQLGDVYFESKYKTPDGLILDVGHWRGTAPVHDAVETAATAD